jgi:hypothetical protein
MKVSFQEVVWEGMDWIHLAQGRNMWSALMNVAMSLWVPKIRGIY